MGFIGLSALLAARVLGPAAGVRVTVGPKGTPAAKHAAIMGADVRPCTPEDMIVDQKARVYTTPGFLAEARGCPAWPGDGSPGARGGGQRPRGPRAGGRARPSRLPVETTGPSRGSA